MSPNTRSHDRHKPTVCPYSGCAWAGKSNKVKEHRNISHWKCAACSIVCTSKAKITHTKRYDHREWQSVSSPGLISKDSFLKQVFKEYNIDVSRIPFASALFNADLQVITKRWSLDPSSSDYSNELSRFSASFLEVPHLHNGFPWSPELRDPNVVYDHVNADFYRSETVPTTWEGGKPTHNPMLVSRLMREVIEQTGEVEGYVLAHPTPSLRRFLNIPQFFGRSFSVTENNVKVTANVTARRTTVDMHHDDGFVIATLAGGAKLWVVYPEDSENLDALERFYQREDSRFENSYESFTNGVIILQRAGETMYVPPNCPHFVFTLWSGILYGAEILAPELFHSRIRAISSTVAFIQSRQGHSVVKLLSELIRGLAEALAHDDCAELVLKAWVSKADILGSLFKVVSQAKLAALRKVWANFFSATSLTTCPCGSPIEGAFASHFSSLHLSFL